MSSGRSFIEKRYLHSSGWCRVSSTRISEKLNIPYALYVPRSRYIRVPYRLYSLYCCAGRFHSALGTIGARHPNVNLVEFRKSRCLEKCKCVSVHGCRTAARRSRLPTPDSRLVLYFVAVGYLTYQMCISFDVTVFVHLPPSANRYNIIFRSIF